MEDTIGQTVLKSKAIMSYDCGEPLREYRCMSSTAFKAAFIARTKAARKATGRTREAMGAVLQISQDHYKQYETRSELPLYMIPAFCAACDIDPAWLLGMDQKAARKPARKRSAA